MSFMGTVQQGPNADSYRLLAPAIVPVGASCVLHTGTPVRRNVTAVQGQNLSAYPYSAVVAGITAGDQVVVMNSTGGGPLFGVYEGPTTYNNVSGAVGASVVGPNFARAGVAPVLVGTASGGTAITVGCQVGMSSLISGGLGILANNIAAPTGFAQTLVGPASQGLLGTVVGYPFVTALASNITAGTSVSCALQNVIGLGIGVASPAIVFNPGATNTETVALSSVAPGTCATNTITFGNASATTPGVTVTLGNASTGAIPGVPGGIISVSIAATTATTGANFATSVAAALNTAFSALGVAPPNIPGVGGTQIFGIATAATSIVTITAAIPSPNYNYIPFTMPVSGVSSIASGGTSLGGVSTGAYPVCFGTFANNHLAGEPVVGAIATYGATICPVPQPGGSNIALAMVDLEYLI